MQQDNTHTSFYAWPDGPICDDGAPWPDQADSLTLDVAEGGFQPLIDEVAATAGCEAETKWFEFSVDAGSLEGVRIVESTTWSPAPEDVSRSAPVKRPLVGRVLVVEDDSDIQALMRLKLDRMKLSVDMAQNGRLACDAAKRSIDEGKPYNLILMDIQMPQMNGYEAAQRLRDGGWKGPIVAMTACAVLGDREKCLAAGCDDYLMKPLLMSALQNVLERYLKRPTGVSRTSTATESGRYTQAGLP